MKIRLQFLIGACMFCIGMIMVFQCMTIFDLEIKGILLGQGAVLVLWGFREMIGGISDVL